MTLRKIAALLAALIAFVPAGVAAQNASSPETIAATTIERLKEGKSKEAVSGFLGGGKLGIGDAQLAFLADQIDAANKAYGPILSCELVERKTLGSMAERRLYLCQHTSFLTRWTMIFMRTGDGWRGAHIAFDDKFPAAFDNLPVSPNR